MSRLVSSAMTVYCLRAIVGRRGESDAFRSSAVTSRPVPPARRVESTSGRSSTLASGEHPRSSSPSRAYCIASFMMNIAESIARTNSSAMSSRLWSTARYLLAVRPAKGY